LKSCRFMVIFDIPEFLKAEWDWLRGILAESGFILLQKSVWVGEESLPEDLFKEILRRHLQPYVFLLGIRNLGTVGEDLLV